MQKFFIFLLLTFSTVHVLCQDWNELAALKQQLNLSVADTGRINILLKLAEFEIFKPGENKTDLDSAAAYIKQGEIINTTIKLPEANGYILIEKSYLAKDHGDRKKGLALMQQAIQQLSKTNNKYLLAKATYGLSDYHYDYANPDELNRKIFYIQAAAKIYSDAGFVEQEAFCYKNIADLSPDMDSSFFALNKAYALYKSIHYVQMQSVYDLYTQYYYLKNDYVHALHWGLLAYQTADKLSDKSNNMCEIENHLALIYRSIDDRNHEFIFLKKAYDNAKENKDSNSINLVARNLALIYYEKNQPEKAKIILESIKGQPLYYDGVNDPIYYDGAEDPIMFYILNISVYSALNDRRKCETFIEKLIPLINDVKVSPEVKSLSYTTLAQYYLKNRKYEEVKKYLTINDTIVSHLSSPTYLETANNLWMTLDSLHHNYESAFYHALKAKKIHDTIYSIEKLKALQQLQVQFETKGKEQQINFLKQKSALETKNLEQEKQVKNFTIAGIILVLIIAGLFFRQSAIRQRSNKIISEKNSQLQHLVDEKEWLVKEIHHRVKNNLHTVICLLESQAAFLDNDALSAIQKSQHRIYAMSLIHQKLYQSDDLKVINMKVYIAEFIQYLIEGFGSPGNIHVIADVDDIKLSASQAIPSGLIINESVSNSFKYAFPNNRDGKISVALKQAGQRIFLTVADNGVGSQKRPGDNLNSLGLELISGLSNDLHANIVFEVNDGTIIKLDFLIEPLSTEIATTETIS